MKRCQNELMPMRIEACSICMSKFSCGRFRKWYQRNRDDYIKFVTIQVAKHPEKYEIGVVFMSTRVPKTYLIVEGDKITGEMSETDIKDTKKIGKIPKKAILRETTQWQYEPIITVKLKKNKAKPIKVGKK